MKDKLFKDIEMMRPARRDAARGAGVAAPFGRRRGWRFAWRVLSLALTLSLLFNSVSFGIDDDAYHAARAAMESLTLDENADEYVPVEGESEIGDDAEVDDTAVPVENPYEYSFETEKTVLLSQIFALNMLPVPMQRVETVLLIGGEDMVDPTRLVLVEPLRDEQQQIYDYQITALQYFNEVRLSVPTVPTGETYTLALSNPLLTVDGDAEVAEAEALDLGDDDDSADIESADIDSAPFTYSMDGSAQVRLSDVIYACGMPFAVGEVEMVALAGGGDRIGAPVFIEDLGGDYLITAQEDFDDVRLLVYTAQDACELMLFNGRENGPGLTDGQDGADVFLPEPAEESAPVEETLDLADSDGAAAEPVEEMPAEPVIEEQLPEPVEETPSEPVIEEQPAEPVEEIPAEPVEEVTPEPVEEIPSEPVEEPVTEPVEETPSEPVIEEQPAEPVEEPVTEPVEEQPAEPVEEIPAEPVEEPVTEPIEEQPAEPVEEQPAEPIEEQPTEPIEEQPTEPIEEQPTEPIEEQPTEPVEEQPTEPVEEQPTEPVEEQPTEPVEEQPTEPAEEQPTEPIEEQPTEPAEEQPTEPVEEQPTEPVEEQPTEPVEEQPTEPIEEQPTEPVEEQPTEPVEEQPTEPAEAPLTHPAQTFAGGTARVRVRVDAPEGAFPEGTTMSVTPNEDGGVLSGIADAVSGDFVKIKAIYAVDITFRDAEGAEIEPLLPTAVVMRVDAIDAVQRALIVHVDDAGVATVVEQTDAPQTLDGTLSLSLALPGAAQPDVDQYTTEEQPDVDQYATELPQVDQYATELPQVDQYATELPDAVEQPDAELFDAEPEEIVPEQVDDVVRETESDLAFTADAFSTYAVVITEAIPTRTLEAAGDDWSVAINYGADAGIPSDAALEVSEMTGAVAEVFTEQAARVLDVDADSFTYVRVLDMAIVKDGESLQPQAPVDVSVRLDDMPEKLAAEDELRVVHFSAIPQAPECALEGNTVTFEADGFSAYVIALRSDVQYPAQRFAARAAGVSVSVDAPEGAFPEGTTMQARRVMNGDTISEIREAVAEDFVEVKRVQVVDITFRDADGREIEPRLPVSVVMTVTGMKSEQEAMVVHVDDAGAVNVQSSEVQDPQAKSMEVAFDAGTFSMYAVVVTEVIETRYIDADGNTYQIEVGYGADAGIPSGATLRVRELTGAEADAYAARAAETLDLEADDLAYAKALDIAILKDGERVQPLTPVSVSVRLLDAPEDMEEAYVNVVHFGDAPEALNCALDGDTVAFETDGFSVYVITDDTPRLGFVFTVNETAISLDGNGTVTKQIVKKGEKPIIPQPASTEEREFAGWYAQSSETTGGSDLVLYDFDNIQFPPRGYDEITLQAVFKNYAKVVFYGQRDSATEAYPVLYTKRVELPEQAGDPTATVRIDDVSATYSSDDDDATMAFYGWSWTEVVSGLGKDHKITEDTIEVSEYTELYPIFLPIHWLSFNSGPVGSGATYFPPTRYFEGDGTNELDVPVRDGYTFQGWFTAQEGGVKVTDEQGNVVSFTGVADLGYQSGSGTLIPTGNVMLYAHWTSTPKTTASYRIVIWRQKTTDQDGITDNQQKTYDFYQSIEKTGAVGSDAIVDDTYKKYDLTNPIVFGGYTCRLDDNDQEVAEDGSTVLNVWYDRSGAYTQTGATHKLTFVIPGAENVTYNTVAYQALLKGNNDGESYVPKDPEREHYTFLGWFADEACTVRVFFSAEAYADADTSSPKVLYAEMPNNDLTIYAGWEAVWYLVQIDPNYGDLHDSGSTWFWTTYDDDCIKEYTQVTRDYVESNAGTWYYVKHDRAYYGYPDTWVPGENNERKACYTQNPGEATEDKTFEYAPGMYSYAGWYEVHPDGSETPYVFGNPVDHNTKLKLHWKKAGTYYLAYSPGDGALDGADAKQGDYILPKGFADDSQIVLDRSASREGYTFVGWSVRGDDSGRVYALGDSFTLRAEDAIRTNGREIVYLDAVYAQISTAQITYDANGGTVTGSLADNTLDLGGPLDSDAPKPVIEVNGNASATISNLVNNSTIELSKGTGFTKENAVFLGWCTKDVYDPNDAEAVFFDKDSDDTYAVDIQEPMTLYAVWGVQVTYHLNSDSASWGNAWDDAYTFDSATNTYSRTTYLNIPVPEPTAHPTDSGKLFFGWKTAADDTTAYDFTQPVTGALNLYAFWRDPIQVPVHVVDASQEALALKNDTAWTVNDVQVGTESVTLPVSGAVTAPSDYVFAFVAVHSASANLQTISEDEKVREIYYSQDDKHLHAVYANGTDKALNVGTELYYVYYQKKPLSVAYKSMDYKGVLKDQPVQNGAVQSTDSVGAEAYDATTNLSAPLSLVSGGTTYSYYAYAIGDANAENASQLYVITDTATGSSASPALSLRNTWRGLEYSQDDNTWQNCGYAPTLYVVYFEKQPTIILIDEKTVGPNSVMNTTFEYSIVVTQRTGSSDPVPVYDSEVNDDTYRLKNGEEQSAVVFYDSDSVQTITVTQKNTQASGKFTTKVNNTENQKAWTCTATATGGKQTVTFTNTLEKYTVEAHVALIDESNVVESDNFRDNADYMFELTLGDEAMRFDDAQFPLKPETIFTGGLSDYAFGTILCGRQNEDGKVYDGKLDIVSAAYRRPDGAAENIRDVVLTDSNGNSYALGDNRIYYLYYSKPAIRYVKVVDGELEDIVGGRVEEVYGDENKDPSYDGKDLTMNGQKVSKQQRIEVAMSGFRITQEAGADYFRMPPLLDDGTLARYLSYEMIGVGPENADSDGDLQTNPGKNLYIRVSDSKLEWSFDNAAWHEFSEGTPTIYAIYAERGFDLQINKTVNVQGVSDDVRPIFTGQEFTLTISSPVITKESYIIEGTESATVTATPAEDGNPGTITLTVKDGAKVRLQGLGYGDYQIVETGKENYTLSATTGPLIGSEGDQEADVQNDAISLKLDKETKLSLTNTPKPLCRIVEDDVEHIFFTLQSAVEYALDHGDSATVEMLADYLMNDSDEPEIPSGLSITLTTASEDKYVPSLNTSGDGKALIVRPNGRTDKPMLRNSGRLTLGNVTLDGANVAANAAAIESWGYSLTVGAGATIRNAKNVNNGETGGNGGAICATAGDVSVSGSLTGNTADDGGAIYYSGSGSITLSDGGSIAGNTALKDANDTQGTTGNGGAICATGGSIVLSGGTIGGSEAGQANSAANGGAIHYSGNGTITLSGSTLSGNTATGNGGAICATGGTIALSGSGSLTGNTATGNGGAIYSGAGVVNVSGGTIGGSGTSDANSAVNGAAIYVGSGVATLSGSGSLTGNTALKDANDTEGTTGNGGAIYVDSGTVRVTGGSIKGNKAGVDANDQANGFGGAIYNNAGEVNVSGGTIGGTGTGEANRAKNGAAIYVYSGNARFTDGNITGNVAAEGGAVGVGDISARLYFSGGIKVKNNSQGIGSSALESNVYLDMDTDAVINVEGFGSNASVGIHVPDSLVEARSVPGAYFAVYINNTNAGKITNDRYNTLNVQSNTASKKLYWGKGVRVEVAYLASYKNGLPNGKTNHGVQKKYLNPYYPTSYDIALSELAAEIYKKNNLASIDDIKTAVYGGAFKYNAPSYGDDIVRLFWAINEQKWMLEKRNGVTEELGDNRIYIIYAKPAYISIENNTKTKLNINNMTIGSYSVINTVSDDGYGMVFAKNGAIRTALRPIKAADIELNAGESVNLLFPGGQNMSYTLNGSFASTSEQPVRLRRTNASGLSEESVSLNTDGSFSSVLSGTTLNDTGTYKIIFGDDKYICKVVDKSGYDHPYSKISEAINAITSTESDDPPYELETPKTAAIEMLTDYLLTTSDEVIIPKGYNITLKTAAKKGATYTYTGEGERATISRDSENTGAMFATEAGSEKTSFTVEKLIIDGKSVRGNAKYGAIKADDCEITLKYVDIINIYAENGGGLFVTVAKGKANSRVTVEHSYFNSCYSTATGGRNGGGAIHAYVDYFTVTDSSFYSCEAGNQAGAVFHRVEADYTSESIIKKCVFQDCKANAGGGLELDSKNITVEDCTFQHCVASRNGGGFNVWALNASNGNPEADCSVTVKNCIFNDCQMTGSNNGGGFRCNAVSTTVYGCDFINCSSGLGGGMALTNTNAKKAEIYGCTFDRCTASNQGGGIHGKPKELIIGDYTWTDDKNETHTRHTVIKNCESKNEGGGVCFDKNTGSSNMTITNAIITGNKTKNADKSGGGVYAWCKNLEISGADISENRATLHGGGIYFDCSNATNLTIKDSTVSGNKVSADGSMGAGIYCKKNLIMQNTLVLNNQIQANNANALNAAGVYIADNNGKLTIGDISKMNDADYTDNSCVMNNTTQSGVASNLRLPENNNVNANCVTVKCNLGPVNDKGGYFGVVNAKIVETQFGKAEFKDPGGFSDQDAVFHSDNDTLIGKIKEDNNRDNIIWAGPPVCKITDGAGNLLYFKNNGTDAAIFSVLDDGEPANTATSANRTSALRLLRMTSAPELYKADGTPYYGPDYCVKMLVEAYTSDHCLTTANITGRSITLTTARAEDADGYPYKGKGTSATITRGTAITDDAPFLTAKLDLTLTNVILDGGSESGVTAGSETSIACVDYDGCTLTLGNNAVLRNGETIGNGGGVLVKNGMLVLSGKAEIRACQAAKGGGIYTLSSGKVTVNGKVSNCKAEYGGGIYIGDEIGSAGVVTEINGGTIQNCEAKYGGGVYKQGGGALHFKNGKITDCKAVRAENENDTGIGGGVYLAKGSFEMIGSTTAAGGIIEKCEAHEGGGLYVVSDPPAPFTMSGGSITGNHASGKGGGIAVGGDGARLNLCGAITITGNTSESSRHACNIELDADSISVIHVYYKDNDNRGLLNSANVGVYVPGDPQDANSPCFKHGVANTPFGNFFEINPDENKWIDTATLYRFTNDRFSNLHGMTSGVDGDSSIIWGEPIARVCEWNNAKDERQQKWSYHRVLVNDNEDATGIDVGAFNRANSLKGKKIVIETLLESDSRYGMAAGFTFNKNHNVTLCTTQNETWNPKREGHFTTTIIRADTFGSLLTVDNKDSSFKVMNITLDGNASFLTATTDGGLIHVTNGALEIAEGATLQNSETSGNGGAVYLADKVTFTMTGGTIKDSIAVLGGGIYAVGHSNNKEAREHSRDSLAPTMVMTGGSISGNTAKTAGGGMYIAEGTVAELTNVQISNNTVDGTAHYENSTVLQDKKNYDDYSEGCGGGIFADRKTTIKMTGCTINGNQAGCTRRTYDGTTIVGGTGGGIYLYNSNNWEEWAAARAYLTNTKVQNNIAVRGGGLGAMRNCTYTITGTDTSISQNTASINGGGFCLWPGYPYLSMAEGFIRGNTANGDGGGFWSDSAQDRVVLDNVKVIENTSYGSGGGGRAQNITLLNGTRISKNTVRMNKDNNNRPDITKGGGLYMRSGTLTLGADTDDNGGIRIEQNHVELINYDIAPYSSDLRLSEKKDRNGNDKSGDNWENSVKLLGNFKKGKAYVCNPGTLDSNFGTSESADYLDDIKRTELWTRAAFVSQDGSKLYGRIRPKESGSGYDLYWHQDYVCKITDGKGNLLYKEDGTPAVYMRLYEENNKLNSAFGTLNDAKNKLYYPVSKTDDDEADGGEAERQEYTDDVFRVKMLTDFELMEPVLIGNPVEDREITLETAEPYSANNKDKYYFRGNANDSAVIKPGHSMTNDTNAFMFRVQKDIQMTFQNITLDGGAVYYTDKKGNLRWNHDGSPKVDMTNSFISTKDGVLIQMSGTADVILGGWNAEKEKWEKTTLQNAYTTHQYGGAAICFGATNQARSLVINEGTTIRRCCAASTRANALGGDVGGYGGAISFYRGYGTKDELTILGGVIEECWAEAKGGAIFIPNSSEVVSIKGGVIRNCHAPVGGGIYMDDRASGGDYTPNVASSLRIEGNIEYSDNYGTSYNLNGKANGGDAAWYGNGWARQDIYVQAFPWQDWRGNRIDPVKPIIVTGAITAKPGSIRVWVDEDVHDHGYPYMGYHEKDQFAVFADRVKAQLEEADLENQTTVLTDTLKAFRNARDDETTANTTGAYLTGVPGDDSNETPSAVSRVDYIYWGIYNEGFNVAFRKINGNGNALPDATFTLYKANEAGTDCEKDADGKPVPFQLSGTDVTATSGKGPEDDKLLGTNADNAVTIQVPGTGDTVNPVDVYDTAKGLVVFQKIPTGVYFMKETTFPVAGGAQCYKAVEDMYMLEVDPKGCYTLYVADNTGSTPVWSTSNDKAPTTSFIRDGEGEEVYKAPTGPLTGPVNASDVLPMYTVMNASPFERKVALQKVDNSTPTALKLLPGAHFRIFRADLTEVTDGQPTNDDKPVGYYESGKSGVYFMGKLPFGTYYLVETAAPTDYTDNLGKVFKLTVGKDTTAEGGAVAAGTTVTLTTTLSATGGEEAVVTAFRNYMKTNPAA